MRFLAIGLMVLIVLIQSPLWFGKGGWPRVWDLNAQIRAQGETNRQLAARNAALDADVADLKRGYEAIEERARGELGMIKQDEIFFQLMQPPSAALSSLQR